MSKAASIRERRYSFKWQVKPTASPKWELLPYENIRHLVEDYGILTFTFPDKEANDKNARTAATKQSSFVAYDVQGRPLLQCNIPVQIPDHVSYDPEAALVAHVDPADLEKGVPPHVGDAMLYDGYKFAARLDPKALSLPRPYEVEGHPFDDDEDGYIYTLTGPGGKPLHLLVDEKGGRFKMKPDQRWRTIYTLRQGLNSDRYDDVLDTHSFHRHGRREKFMFSRRQHALRLDVLTCVLQLWAWLNIGNEGIQLGERRQKKSGRIVPSAKGEHILMHNSPAAFRKRGVKDRGIISHEGGEPEAQTLHDSERDAVWTAATVFFMRRTYPEAMRELDALLTHQSKRDFQLNALGSIAPHQPFGLAHYIKGEPKKLVCATLFTDEMLGDMKRSIVFNLSIDPSQPILNGKRVFELSKDEIKQLMLIKDNPVFLTLENNKSLAMTDVDRAIAAGAGDGLTKEQALRRCRALQAQNIFLEHARDAWMELNGYTQPNPLDVHPQMHHLAYRNIGTFERYRIAHPITGKVMYEPMDVYKRAKNKWDYYNKFDAIIDLATEGHTVEYAHLLDEVQKKDALADYQERLSKVKLELYKLQKEKYRRTSHYYIQALLELGAAIQLDGVSGKRRAQMEATYERMLGLIESSDGKTPIRTGLAALVRNPAFLDALQSGQPPYELKPFFDTYADVRKRARKTLHDLLDEPTFIDQVAELCNDDTLPKSARDSLTLLIRHQPITVPMVGVVPDSTENAFKHLWLLRHAWREMKLNCSKTRWVCNGLGQRIEWNDIIKSDLTLRDQLWPKRESERDQNHLYIRFYRYEWLQPLITMLTVFGSERYFEEHGTHEQRAWWKSYINKHYEAWRPHYEAYVAICAVHGPPNLDPSQHPVVTDASALRIATRIKQEAATSPGGLYAKEAEHQERLEKWIKHYRRRMRKHPDTAEKRQMAGFDAANENYPELNIDFRISKKDMVEIIVPDEMLDVQQNDPVWNRFLLVNRAGNKQALKAVNAGKPLLLVGKNTGMYRFAAKAMCHDLPQNTAQFTDALQQATRQHQDAGMKLEPSDAVALRLEQITPIVGMKKKSGMAVQAARLPDHNWKALVSARAGGLPKGMGPVRGVIERDVGQNYEEDSKIRLRRTVRGPDGLFHETGDQFNGKVKWATSMSLEEIYDYLRDEQDPSKLDDRKAHIFGWQKADDVISHCNALAAEAQDFSETTMRFWVVRLKKEVKITSYSMVLPRTELPRAMIVRGAQKGPIPQQRLTA